MLGWELSKALDLTLCKYNEHCMSPYKNQQKATSNLDDKALRLPPEQSNAEADKERHIGRIP